MDNYMQKKYEQMDTESLLRILAAKEGEYTEQALTTARNILKTRGEYREENINQASEQINAELKAEAEMPLSLKGKILCMLFPGWGFITSIGSDIVNKNRTKYNKDLMFWSTTAPMLFYGLIALFIYLSRQAVK